MSSAKCCSFRLGLNVLTLQVSAQYVYGTLTSSLTQDGLVFIWPVKCGMKLLIHSQTSAQVTEPLPHNDALWLSTSTWLTQQIIFFLYCIFRYQCFRRYVCSTRQNDWKQPMVSHKDFSALLRLKVPLPTCKMASKWPFSVSSCSRGKDCAFTLPMSPYTAKRGLQFVPAFIAEKKNISLHPPNGLPTR